MINSVRQLVDSELEGRVRQYYWRKVPSQVTTASYWFDLSMSPGNPVPKYWFDSSPGIAKQVAQSTDGGLYHGPSVLPQTKYLRQIMGMNLGAGTPMNMILCDYLLYYPSIDDSVTDPQVLDNTVTLPRYQNGDGVQAIAITLAARTGSQRFYFTYTNQDGVSGRVSQTVTQNAVSSIGTVATSNPAALQSGAPFIGLQSGDHGIRSIDSVQMLGADVGLFALILVKPLASFYIRDNTAVVEKDFFLGDDQVIEIKNDAYLSFLTCPQGSLSGVPIHGDLKIIWN